MPATSYHRVLSDIFGFESFRPHQQRIIEALLAREDVFAALPTGGGKSLCYQIPALVLEGLTVVVSPLIALMKDQVDAARELGVAAGYLNSSLTPEERHRVLRALELRQLRILYVAPERLASGENFERLAGWGVSLVAIDEAHCISEWGHEFRPDYRLLSRIREVLPEVPVGAFTATATRRVQEDVLSLLGLRDPVIVRASFDRPEIFYRVELKRDLRERIQEFVLARRGRSGIIYRATRADVERTAQWLNGLGVAALPYHAGLPDEVRREHQERFKRDEVPVIVATIAFGMGIDKPDVRYVVHGDLPKTLEAFYQESGRAGRDGDDAEALLLWSPADLAKIRFHINRMADPAERERADRGLRAIARFASSCTCRRKGILAHLDEEHPGDCGRCDVCTGEVETVDATDDARKLLSAMARTGERFGAHHIVDILRGTETDKVVRRRHHDLPTFGVGRDRTRKYWLAMAEDLEGSSLIYRDEERYRALRMTGEGRELLYGRREFRALRRAEGAVPAERPDDLPFDETLFDRLRTLRSSLARRRGIPPYMIFADRTLRAMAALRPTDPGRLLQCPGVGRKKLETYGEEFLAVIRGEP